ncbi:MAG TPA: phospho-N-acetylmuramoyl-pentapeptide-transferase, partial [Candidatus Dorea intestinavium]|nr:phospho-N-acetylmuramoyl-pentapeptide-transferase [Candidatus Dorea intestinavium]
MDNKILLGGIIAFIIVAILGPIVIPILKRLKLGQTEREEGVKEHLKKAGTPTMGGIMIIVAIVIPSLFFIDSFKRIIPILILTVGFGIIGFLDDYLKVIKKDSDGLMPLQKLVLQFGVTGIFAFYLLKYTDVGLKILLPFSGGKYIEPGTFGIVLLFIAVLGTVNGVNFTDGLDGLASSVTIPVAVFFAAVSLSVKGGIIPIAVITTG